MAREVIKIMVSSTVMVSKKTLDKFVPLLKVTKAVITSIRC